MAASKFMLAKVHSSLEVDALDKLAGREFQDKYMAVASADTLVSLLASDESVRAVRRALEAGAVPESRVREFVGTLLGGMRRGRSFPYQTALCGLAVAVSDLGIDVADEFLDGLARLKVREMRLAHRAAALYLAARRRRVATCCSCEHCDDGDEEDEA